MCRWPDTLYFGDAHLGRSPHFKKTIIAEKVVDRSCMNSPRKGFRFSATGCSRRDADLYYEHAMQNGIYRITGTSIIANGRQQEKLPPTCCEMWQTYRSRGLVENASTNGSCHKEAAIHRADNRHLRKQGPLVPDDVCSTRHLIL
jgi:hypothetical protein